MKNPPITTTEAAKRLNSTDRFIRKIILSGALPAFRLGDKGFRIDPDDLDAYIAAQTVKPSVDPVSVALSDLHR
jgi:excisionase family DNA binding protein